MKKFFLLIVLVFTGIVSFGQIMIPKDSIHRLISETAQKNNLKNPDRLYIGQEVLLYFGEYVKIPVLVKVKQGDNLSNLLHYQIATMPQFEQDMRNYLQPRIKAGLEVEYKELNLKTPNTSKKEVKMTPEVKWSIFGLFILFIIFMIPIINKLKKRFKKK